MIQIISRANVHVTSCDPVTDSMTIAAILYLSASCRPKGTTSVGTSVGSLSPSHV